MVQMKLTDSFQVTLLITAIKSSVSDVRACVWHLTHGGHDKHPFGSALWNNTV